MYKTLTWALVLITSVFESITIDGFLLSASKTDFFIQETSDTSWSNMNQHCYSNNKQGVAQLCWEANLRYKKTTLEMKITCTLVGLRNTDVMYKVDESPLKSVCTVSNATTVKTCGCLIQPPELYADKQFSCYFYQNNQCYTLKTFQLLDNGKPSKPMLTQEGSSLNCYANNSRSSSVLEIIKLESPNNNISIIEKYDKEGQNPFVISYDLPSPSSGKFVCRHKYNISGRSEDSDPLQAEVNSTIPATGEPISKDKILQHIIYGVIAVFVFGIFLCLIVAFWKCWKNGKGAYNPTESTEDIFAYPVQKEQRNEDEYAVPVPKSQRNVTEEYAMVVPKNKRPGYADPAYADPCDLRHIEPDSVYMDIGSALYASISIYDEVALPYGSSDCESIQYANSETIKRIRTSASPRSHPIYASVKSTRAPRPRPRQRLKPTQYDGYVDML